MTEMVGLTRTNIATCHLGIVCCKLVMKLPGFRLCTVPVSANGLIEVNGLYRQGCLRC